MKFTKTLSAITAVSILLIYTSTLTSSPLFRLCNEGTEDIVDYAKYGEFTDMGTPEYHYRIINPDKLSNASGEGIYPNKTVLNDPDYKRLTKDKKLEGSPWDYVAGPDYKVNFYKWASIPVDDGTKLFFTALALKEAGLYRHAIKAYYAIIVHFPKDTCWSKDGSFVWYIGPAAMNEIINLTRSHPELGIELLDAKIAVINGDDADLGNDQVIVNPGKLQHFSPESRNIPKYDLNMTAIKQHRGSGKVRFIQYSNLAWQLLVDDKIFFIRGVTYTPSPVGLSPKNTSLNNWMTYDSDKNGILDIPYETWIDLNKNSKKDASEEVIGDFQLLKNMGCNTIRIFYDETIDKKILRDMHDNYGIHVAMCNFIGAYTVGSGASWEKGTDYTDPSQKQRMKENVTKMINEHKNESYMLMWILGNENNLPADYTGINATRTNAAKYPEEYAIFLNDTAKMIHELDPNHPVAVGNLETKHLDYYAKYAPEIDALGINSYRGKDGFGRLWQEVRDTFDRPIFLKEFGCDAYYENKGEDEDSQAIYHKNCWEDIYYNRAGWWGEGNSIGGIVFEWLDEWWKDNQAGDSSFKHQTASQCDMAFPDGRSHEEWFGVCSQGNGSKSPFLRQLRKTYYLYKKMWNNA